MIGERHDHPALAGLSQIEGVTPEAAVSLTSNHTQPAAGRPASLFLVGGLWGARRKRQGKKRLKLPPPPQQWLASGPLWCPKLPIIKKATLDPTEDAPSEHSGAKLFRKGVLLFVLE